MRTRAFLLGFFLFAIPVLSSAQAVVTPTLIMGTEQGGRYSSFHTLDQRAVTTNGQLFYLKYTSDKPAEVLVAPFRTQTEYNPRDLVHAHLEPGKEQEIIIDISVSPAWSPGATQYFMWLMAEDDTTKLAIEDAGMIPGKWYHIPLIALRQLFTLEKFQVSVFHTLYGYRMIDVPVIPIIGGLLLVLSAFLLYRAKKKDVFPAKAIGVVVVLLLVYQARFAVDLARHSYTHLASWYGNHRYEQADAAYAASELLVREQELYPRQSIFTYVCTADSDYYAKVLRYAVYPQGVTVAPTSQTRVTHVLVHHAKASFDDDILVCGNFTGKARVIHTLPDGAVLYSLLPPRE